jgi:glycosyltransferase involved in cell wall biosynthesis
MSFGKSKARVADAKQVKTRFKDVAGVDEAKEELVEVVDFLKHPRTYLAMGRAERAIVIPNGIALPTWNSLTHHEGPKNILTVGGIKPRKGILEAVEACAAYKRRSTTSFVFTIVGSVHELEYEQLLQRRIAALGLQDTVRIAGFVSDAELMELYKNADLYLMPVQTTPDVFEGFGLVYLEANAFGVPCIGPDKSGAAEAIEEGTSGYHVNVDDGEQIAERMAWILDERRIDPASCRSWAERHSLEVVCTRTEAVYNTLSRI